MTTLHPETPKRSLGFNTYQERAHSTSLIYTLPNSPEQEIADRMIEEESEILLGDTLHGRPLLYLMLIPGAELTGLEKEETAKEFGDFLWYTSEAAQNKNIRLEGLALSAANRYACTKHQTLSIDEFDLLAHQHGPDYSVINHKISMSRSDNTLSLTSEPIKVAVSDNPGYVLQRVFSRLIAYTALSNEVATPGPPSSVEFDEITSVRQSPEDALWVMSTIAQKMLNTTLAEIASINIKKTETRLARGTTFKGEGVDRSDER